MKFPSMIQSPPDPPFLLNRYMLCLFKDKALQRAEEAALPQCGLNLEYFSNIMEITDGVKKLFDNLLKSPATKAGACCRDFMRLKNYCELVFHNMDEKFEMMEDALQYSICMEYIVEIRNQYTVLLPHLAFLLGEKDGKENPSYNILPEQKKELSHKNIITLVRAMLRQFSKRAEQRFSGPEYEVKIKEYLMRYSLVSSVALEACPEKIKAPSDLQHFFDIFEERLCNIEVFDELEDSEGEPYVEKNIRLQFFNEYRHMQSKIFATILPRDLTPA